MAKFSTEFCADRTCCPQRPPPPGPMLDERSASTGIIPSLGAPAALVSRGLRQVRTPCPART